MDIDVLRRAPLFASLDDQAFAALTEELTEVDLSRGSTLFHEGDPGDQLYFIISGKIKLGRRSSDGRENLLAVLGRAAPAAGSTTATTREAGCSVIRSITSSTRESSR